MNCYSVRHFFVVASHTDKGFDFFFLNQTTLTLLISLLLLMINLYFLVRFSLGVDTDLAYRQRFAIR